MREILFRGQTDEGHWVYGDYYVDREEGINYIREFINDAGNGIDDPPCTYQKDYAVNVKTVTQYIGLNDCKGKKIFDGDITEYQFKKKTRIGDGKRVESPGFQRHEISFYRGCFCHRIIKPKKSYFYKLPPDWDSLFHKDTQKFLTIVGNKFENPELLTKG
jgi:uncharacterized phage protein (TIGR01671 family)